MTEAKARRLAGELGGTAHHSGGGIWLVLITAGDGRVVAIGDESICEYRDRAAFDAGDETTAINLI